MPVSCATIPTTEASRLIKRLCTHWAHKFAVQWDAGQGEVPFDATTRATFRASDDTLHVQVESADSATLEKIEQVVASHLERMARAGALHIVWQRPA